MERQLGLFLQEILKSQGIAVIQPNIFLLPSAKGIVYRCAIALQLEAQKANPWIIWAETFYNAYLESKSSNFNLKITPNGYLDCYVTSVFLAQWLEKFPLYWMSFCQDFGKKIDVSQSNNFNPFSYQFLHARCCCLRRLAFQEKLLAINTPIPWLSSSKRLNLSDPREWTLLRQLIHTVDRIDQVSAQQLLRLMTNLGQAFWQFERYCRIFGEVYRSTTEISLVRLGLIAYTELIFKDLLIKGFNMEAMTEI